MESQELARMLTDHAEWLQTKRLRGNRVDLRYEDLYGINLAGETLAMADFTGAEMEGADLSQSDLELVVLSDADLTGACLTGANLSYAVLYTTILTGADLSGAILSDADLSSADLSGANLTDADLTDADLSCANLTDANLKGAILRGATLKDTQLKGTRLEGVMSRVFDTFRRSWPVPCMDTTRIPLADASGNTINQKLTTVLRRHRGWLETSGARGQFADLSGQDLSNICLFNVTLSGATLRGANLAGSDLSFSKLTDADFSGASMTGTTLRCADLAGANLSNANLSNADLFNANLSEARLDGANLDGAILGENDWPEASRRQWIVPGPAPHPPREDAAPHPEPPKRIETERLLLRQTVSDDVEAIFREYAQDPEVTRFLCWSPHTTITQTRDFLNRCSEVWKAGTAFPYAILRKGSDTVIGMIELRVEGHRAEFGYVLAKAHWGKGYTPEALSALIAWARAQSGIHRVWAYCDIENSASQRVMEKAGMEREGVIRRWAMMPNFGNAPRDCFFYSLPETE